jgi:hypothetical protein
MARWNTEGIPHKGWRYVGMEDLGDNALPGDEIQYEQCEMCGNEKIRYVHLLTHPDYLEELRVGCVCASKMTDDYVNPREREKDLRNRANRRKNFIRREWNYKPETGNYTLKYKGEYITIMKSKFGSGWGVIFKGVSRWDCCGHKIRDLDTAKNVAFNLFDELYEPHQYVAPYWDGDRWIVR